MRRINLSLAAVVLVCFFLPWVQVSCGAAHDTLSGLDLARSDRVVMWLIPLLMAAVLVLGLVRIAKARGPLFAIASAVSGAITLYLMNDERVRVNDEAGVISARLTGWFWLGLISCVGVIVSALALLFKKRKSDADSAT